MRYRLPLLIAVMLSLAVSVIPSVDADGTSMMRMDDSTFLFASDVPGLWDFGDGTSSYSKGGSLLHTFPPGKYAATFTSADGSITYIANVFDGSPVITGSAGTEYRCRLPDSVGVKAFDSDGNTVSWLKWDDGRSCAVGIPPKEGLYLVMMHLSDGSTWSYDLTVSEPTPSTPKLSVELSSEGLRLRGEPSVNLSGRFVEWSVYDINGNRTAISNQSVLDIELPSPGTYCVIVETVYGEPFLTASGLVTLTENSNGGDMTRDFVLIGIIASLGASVVILRRLI